MNKQQYDALDDAQKLIATEAYIDGFQACMNQVKSITVRVGDQDVDKTFRVNRESITAILQHSFEKLLIDGLPIMDETNRIDRITAASVKALEDLLEAMVDESLDKDHFLAETYARLVAAELLGYSVTALAEDAEEATQRLLDLIEESEATDEILEKS
jgi:hypothetical protein